MYRCRLEGIEQLNQYEELIKTFFSQGQYHLTGAGSGDEEISDNISNSNGDACRVFSFHGDKNHLKREMYRDLQKETGKSPKWGILTGIRPVKLAGELYDSFAARQPAGTSDSASIRRLVRETLEWEYLLHPSKSGLVTEILEYQRSLLGRPEPRSVSVYIGIPFCPTRCLYCSFTSNQVKKPEIDRYLDALFREIAYCGRQLREGAYRLESLYIGGGTPTTLDENQLAALLEKIADSFDVASLKEYTVEAGRPDTITTEKLAVLKRYGVGRISINPQSMKDETLQLIGRAHTAEDTLKAFALAGDAGIDCINTDLIAGLPEESLDDFKQSLEKVIALGAENITLHTLAVKRASRLKEIDPEFHYKNEALREDMLSYAHETLRKCHYRPYYLYRQKHTSASTENIGFCRNDTLSAYNVRIMEEAQSILALGAGGISKVYFPDENRLERVANVSNYEIYIDRIDEMIQRKENNFWR